MVYLIMQIHEQHIDIELSQIGIQLNEYFMH